jgi:hypothetical protein
MILTDNGSIVLADFPQMPTALQMPFVRPSIIQYDEQSITASEPQAPIIIEYVVQNPPVVIISGEKTTVIEIASGPRGPKGAQGDRGPALSALEFVGQHLQITFENGETELLPLEGHIDGGNF